MRYEILIVDSLLVFLSRPFPLFGQGKSKQSKRIFMCRVSLFFAVISFVAVEKRTSFFFLRRNYSCRRLFKFVLGFYSHATTEKRVVICPLNQKNERKINCERTNNLFSTDGNLRFQAHLFHIEEEKMFFVQKAESIWRNNQRFTTFIRNYREKNEKSF